MNEHLIGLQTTASVLDIGESQVYKLIKEKKLEAHSLGNRTAGYGKKSRLFFKLSEVQTLKQKMEART